MRRSIVILATVGMLVVALAVPAFARNTGRGTGPVVNVLSQGLTYDSIVVADPLPFNGTDNWQQLIPTAVMGVLNTQYGPGDVGYFGGRWFVDMDGDNLPSEGDHFFVCPLLGPGTPTA